MGTEQRNKSNRRKSRKVVWKGDIYGSRKIRTNTRMGAVELAIDKQERGLIRVDENGPVKKAIQRSDKRSSKERGENQNRGRKKEGRGGGGRGHVARQKEGRNGGERNGGQCRKEEKERRHNSEGGGRKKEGKGESRKVGKKGGRIIREDGEKGGKGKKVLKFNSKLEL